VITDMSFVPVSGAFATAPIEEFVSRLPHTRRDVADPATFIVAPDQDTLASAVSLRETDTNNFPTNVTLVSIYPHRIDLAYRLEPLEAGRTFVAWLRDHYQVRICDEESNDVTASVDPGLVYLFGAP